MKLINFGNEPPVIEAVHAQSLDDLWQEAERLGRVSVESKIISEKYEAEIVFVRKSGTRIYAKCEHSNAAIALAGAINEAREMGAGVHQ